MSLDEKPDFSEPELSEEDMKRLSQMGLDNIIEQVTTDTSSVDDLFDDTKEEKDNINNQNNKEKADEKKADVNMAVDTVDNDETAADSAKASKKGKKKQKKEKKFQKKLKWQEVLETFLRMRNMMKQKKNRAKWKLKL